MMCLQSILRQTELVWLVSCLVFSLAGCEKSNEGPPVVQESNQSVSPETSRFHQVVKEGTLADLQQLLKSGIDVNAAGEGEINALMIAMELKDPEKMQLLLASGADPELTDEHNATALDYAVTEDFVAGVRELLARGVDRGYHPKYPLKKIDYSEDTFDFGKIKMPEEFKGVLTEEEWRESFEETKALMAEMGQNPTVEPAIAGVHSVEVLELFLKAGDDLSLADPEMKRLLLKLNDEAVFHATPAEYLKYKTPRYGTTNPERMDNPFWSDMVQIGCNAYQAREHFQDDTAFTKPGAVWCAERFGSSLTPVKEGRYVQVGGEHEDYYDPDFYIYNDVIIYDGKGSFQILGYPKDVFPPTDFHTATLADDLIYLIGCLGYPEQRKPGFTPVYRLNTNSWKIEAVKTSGEMPGWISNHRARYEPTKNVIRVEAGKLSIRKNEEELDLVDNQSDYELDLSTLVWRKLN
ncbi:ankyrin repeat domain-containing protein [Gimesia sp.]|uniref:ankyrin repeat domain-containing protein n=1 Tax=Gimesia sp. TaxID=2024833 RepID=UPI003A925180